MTDPATPFAWRHKAAVIAAILAAIVTRYAWSEPIVEVGSAAVPGGWITVMIKGYTGAADGELVLSHPDGREISSNILFAVEGELEPALGIVGIPAWLEPGSYFLAVVSQTGDVLHRQPFEIGKREFVSETISLSSPMSNLRQTDNPRRAEESRELWTILNSYDLLAIAEYGPYAEPVEGYVTTSFYGDRRTFKYSDGGTDKSTHNGIDLAAPKGTPVRCSGTGKAVFAAERLITGNTVVVEHAPGVYSLYYHLDSLQISDGAKVAKGQVIGTLGDTGLVTGAHLHWEFRIGGVAVEPDLMLSLRW